MNCNTLKSVSEKMSVNSKITSDEWYDPFPSEDIFDKGDTCLSNKYKELSKDLFGETEERMTRLITDLKDVARKKGIEVPGAMELLINLNKSFVTVNFLISRI